MPRRGLKYSISYCERASVKGGEEFTSLYFACIAGEVSLAGAVNLLSV